MYVYALEQRERERDCNFETIGIYSTEEKCISEMDIKMKELCKWYEFRIERFMLDV